MEQMSPWNLQEGGKKRPKAEEGNAGLQRPTWGPTFPQGAVRSHWGAQLRIRTLQSAPAFTSLSPPHLRAD